MQYHNDFLEDSILLSDNNISTNIFNNEYINNRAINGDTVYILNNTVVGIKERIIIDIVGILYLDSKIKYGNIKDRSLYLFKPTNKIYPNFYVPYKIIKNKNKVFCIIQFKEWKKTDKLPIGTLMDIIGNIGNKESEIEHMRIYYGIKNNTWKIDENVKNRHIKLIEDIQSIKEDYEVFSIDPLGSTDIDDAFHFKEDEVGVHIASPTKFFDDDYIKILERVSTVYLPNKKYNMLPNLYADNILSLLENHKRYAISIIFKIKNNKIDSFEIKETIVKNIKNYDYDSYDNQDFMDITKKIFNINDTYMDSHKLVEYWMIYTNKFIAKYLIDNNYENIILRTHEKSCDISELNVDSDLNNYLKMKNEKSALYTIFKEDMNQVHSKLGNEYYTHFTSPIRRAIDYYIHMLLLNKNTKDFSILNYVDKINIFTKNCRKFDRTIRRLNFLYDIKGSDKNIETYAFIINIMNNRLTLYIPEYNLEEKVNIMLDKTYTMYQKINIKLWVFLSFDNIYDKLKIEII